jgi:hypothetical protein
MRNGRIGRIVLFTLLLLFASPFAGSQSPAGAAPLPGSALSIPQAQLLQPEELNRWLQSGGADKPLVRQVGSHILYAEAHIPGSEYAGPGSRPGGLQVLQDKVSSRARAASIVLYCGCCPWDRCPNIAPAFSKLREMGFTNVKVLYLADNFGTNWVGKGYQVEKGR